MSNNIYNIKYSNPNKFKYIKLDEQSSLEYLIKL